jgi:MATE family multidrug resistance protein
MAVVGQLGSPALLGGVALGALVFDFLFTTCNFLRSGTTGLVSQAVGRGDRREQAAVMARAVIAALAIGLLILVFQGPLIDTALALLAPGPQTEAATRAYFDIRVLAAPLTLVNYALFGWLVGLGRAGTALALQIGLNGVNIALSIWFGLYLGHGIAGVAWGTVLAEAMALLGGAAVAAAVLGRAGTPTVAEVIDRARLLAMFAVNRDIMIRSFVLLTAFFAFSAVSARLGDVTLAANAVLEKLWITAAYFLDGIATAAETFAGRAIGGRRRETFGRMLRLTGLWSIGLGLGAALVVYFGGGALIALMTTAEAVRAEASRYLVYCALVPLIAAPAFLMDGVFIGATWSREMRDMMLISLVAFALAVAALVPPFGNDGLWIAILIFMGMRGVTLSAVCRRRMAIAFK